MEFIYERKINYYETDKMGIVHHSNYIRFLEEARCAFLDKIGLPYSELENRGVMIPVLSVNCSYKYHVSFNDVIEIHTIIKDFTGVKLTIEYTAKDKCTGNTVLIAQTKHCFTDTSIKPINLKKHYTDMYEKFMNISMVTE